MCDNRSKGKGLIEFGSYPFDEDGTVRPIKWMVLKQESNKALILSAFGLEAKPYNAMRKSITWETCALRKWLNEDFYNAAFTENEKKRIILTNVQNADNSKYNTPGGNSTEDKVFLLSIDEAGQYLLGDERKFIPTPYAVKKGVWTWDKGKCWWWLRSPGNYPACAADVGFDGALHDEGRGVNYGRSSICPALWIRLDS